MSETRDAAALLGRFVGCVVEQVDCSPHPEMVVVRMRAPQGRVSWVAFRGAFDLPVEAHELPAGHRVLHRIERAAEVQAAADRAARLADRRAGLMPTASPDDCPPHGIHRPVVVS